MRRILHNRLPHSYYHVKNALVQSARTYRNRYIDHGALARTIEHSGADCILVFETECASKQYRVDHALECFRTMGFSPFCLSAENLTGIGRYGFLKRIRFAMIHRVPLNPSLKGFLVACRSASIPLVFDCDDAIHDFDMYKHSAVFDLLNDLEISLHRRMTQQIRKVIRICDAVTVSTAPLADALHPTGKPVTIVPNRISRSMLETVADTHPTDTGPVMGYMSGTETHHRDFAGICESIQRVLERVPDARLMIAGHLELPASLADSYFEKITRIPFQVWPDFLANYSRLTVNLAPLEPDNPFCYAKSGVKYLEAALSCVPTIASPTPDFTRLITNEVNGYLADTPERWTDVLTHCMTSPDSIRKTGMTARAHVLEHEMITANLPVWNTCLSSLGVNL